MSTDNSEIDIVPYCQGFAGISTLQDLSEQGPVQVSAKGIVSKCSKDQNDIISTDFSLIDLETWDGTLVAYAQVRYIDLDDNDWIVCVL